MQQQQVQASPHDNQQTPVTILIGLHSQSFLVSPLHVFAASVDTAGMFMCG